MYFINITKREREREREIERERDNVTINTVLVGTLKCNISAYFFFFFLICYVFNNYKKKGEKNYYYGNFCTFHAKSSDSIYESNDTLQSLIEKIRI